MFSRDEPDFHVITTSQAPQGLLADIRALLKPDQQKKFDEIQKQRAERKAEWAQFQAWKAQQPQKAQ